MLPNSPIELGGLIGLDVPASLFFMLVSPLPFEDIYLMDATVDVSYEPLPPNPIPEPATVLLIGTGLVALAGYRKKRA
jgi:hypothetical protein